MNNEIEKMARCICLNSALYDTCEECFRLKRMRKCNYKNYAEEFYDYGYRKTVWHKVADGDLPKQENGNVIAMPVQACYTNEIGIKINGPCYFFFITGNFRELNSARTLDVIAWTELPKYKGDEK